MYIGGNMEANVTNGASCFETENITTLHDADGYGYSIGETIYSIGFLPLIVCIGVIGNVAFIFVVSSVPRMHNSTNCYLMNLAVADVAFILIGVGEKLYRYTNSPIHGDDTPIRRGGCIWIYLIIDTTYFASLCFVSLVSIERYSAVCKPQSRYLVSKGKSVIFAIVAWMVSMGLAAALIPSASAFYQICLLWPESGRYSHFPDSWGICTASRPWIKAFGDGMQTIPFFFTLAINAAIYILIVRGLNHSVSRLKKHSEGGTEMDSRMRDQISRMLVINGVAFFSCLAPFEILSFLDMISGIQKRDLIHNDVFASLIYFARALSYINCAINPIIYTTMSQRYRRAFKQAFCRELSPAPTRGQSCTAKYIGSTTQDHLRITIDNSRI